MPKMKHIKNTAGIADDLVLGDIFFRVGHYLTFTTCNCGEFPSPRQNPQINSPKNYDKKDDELPIISCL
jgi:hypothetical protein